MEKAKDALEFSNTLTVRTLKDYATGAGYDGLKYVRANPAIKRIRPDTDGQSSGDFQMWVAASARELINEIKAELDMRAYYMGAEAGVAAKLISTFEMKESSFIIIARQTIEARNQNITRKGPAVKLTKDAKRRLAKSLDSFHRKYGGYYCHTVIMGGELYVAYQCVMTTTDRATEVSSKIDVSVPDIGSLMANVSAVMTSEAKDSHWRMTAQTQGAGGTIDDFDPSDPDSVRAAIMKFMRDFAKNVHENPEPYYGQYDGYWRFFEEAEPLKQKIIEADKKVEAISKWCVTYADQIATINSFLDPASAEGYHLTAADEKNLKKTKKEIEGVWKTLREAYATMELFEEFKSPDKIDGVKDHPPEEYAKQIKEWRTKLLAHLIKMGQNLCITLTESGCHVHHDKEQMMQAAPDSDAPEDKWPADGRYVRLSTTKSTAYQFKPVTKKDGDYLCHNDVINLTHVLDDEFKGHMIYMPDVVGVWTVRLFDYVKSHKKKYQWRIKIADCDDVSRRVSTKDTLWITNMNDETCYLCVNSTDYLGVTRDDSDEWKIKLSH